MTIVITGASGNYGRAAAERLIERVGADQLILMTRNPAKLADLAARGCTVRQGDFDDPASLRKAFAGGEKLLLISTARVGKRLPQHRNAIDAAVEAGIKHVVYTSFIGVADDNPALVIRDHGGTEEMLRTSGLAWTALRDSQYSDAMVEAAGPNALRAGHWQAATAGGKIAFITRSDCVDCAVEVLATPGHENRVYDITGPELLGFEDVARIIGRVAGKPIAFTSVSPDEMYAMFDAIGVPRESQDDNVAAGFPWCSEDMVTFEMAIASGHFGVLSDDAAKLLGRTPESFEHFVERRGDELRAFVNTLPKESA
ncbi:SDR family oxidoreductase [Aurantiacibacter xanthus]|uniref:SDR family oxidoreductase n=1 Tax=Aurantiacibacter xanthus TaxID=1784712 RepID=A0A3A1NY79_9SPHN|nr:SDR family oxidoreductase [Aurantiacibacter xanthus]RIV80077.1 SDR family oxidoreductase [Aurantiacibacter xanthus]